MPFSFFWEEFFSLSLPSPISSASIAWTNTHPHADEDHQSRSPTWLTWSGVSRRWTNRGRGGKKSEKKGEGWKEIRRGVFVLAREFYLTSAWLWVWALHASVLVMLKCISSAGTCPPLRTCTVLLNMWVGVRRSLLTALIMLNDEVPVTDRLLWAVVSATVRLR